MDMPFTQTNVWAQINELHNNLQPVTIELADITCLFGVDNIKSMTAYNGPLFQAKHTKHDMYTFLQKVLDFAKDNKITHINFRSLAPLRSMDKQIEEAFVDLGFSCQEWQTILINLEEDEEQLFKNFAHAARKSIRKAIDHKVQVIHCATFEQYYTQYLTPYMAVQGKSVIDRDTHAKSWDLDKEQVYNYWIARDQDSNVLGFLGSYRYGGVATEIMSALTPHAFAQKIPAQDILHHEVIKFHKSLGDKYFDLAGFNPNPISAKEINIRRFKEKWGGEVYHIPSYTLDTRTTLQKIIGRVKRLIHV